jgi:hypothetical protein
MRSNTILTAVLLAGAPVNRTAAAAQVSRPSANPACALLTTAEVRSATGRDYGTGSPGDELGEGLGGGASCQWGGPSFRPGDDLPLLSLVVIPNPPNGSHTEKALKVKPFTGCARETLRGVGDLAFIEICERGRGAVAYVKAGRNDLVVAGDPAKGKPPASAKPVIVAVAKAAAAKARAR